MIYLSRRILFRFTRASFSVIAPSHLYSSDPAPVQGFYNELKYEDTFEQVEVSDLSTPLLPFQKDGVGWMVQREKNHVGGIMADHLGMGKTVQMIGLCLASERMNKSVQRDIRDRAMIIATGNRLLMVLRQLQRVSVVANCSKLNQPGRELKSLFDEVSIAIKKGVDDFADVRKEVDKWLLFATKFHPIYAARATSFLDDEQKRSFHLIDSKELRTLVVVPAALMLQWESEISCKVKASRGIRTYLYHGTNKFLSTTELENYDFVITTYDTLTNSASDAFTSMYDDKGFTFTRRRAGPLFNIYWKRIILDEAHMIRHSRTVRWRAIQELQGSHKWTVTATPLHNSINDLQNLLQFIGLPRLPIMPGSNPDELLNDPLLQRSIARSLQPAFLRRGPVMLRDGKEEVLVQLPPKTERVHKEPFTVDESHMYNSILARSKGALASSEMNDTCHIFTMMTRLRQACCHPWISEGRALQVSICEICKTETTATVVTKCSHYFCQECLLDKFREVVDGDEVALRIPCPACGVSISYKSTFRTSALTSAERIAFLQKKDLVLSTKLEMILNAVNRMLTENPEDKMIIFSQFTSFMDVISVALTHNNIDHLRIDGTMTLTSRNITIKKFQTTNATKVILASKTATGVGLNLTAANHVLVVDPWWNPAIEEQAVHRSYRIGQRKPVFVTRFIISDTIEQYCFDICQKKKEFGDAVLRAATGPRDSRTSKAATSKLQELVSRLKFIGPEDEIADLSNEAPKVSNDKNTTFFTEPKGDYKNSPKVKTI